MNEEIKTKIQRIVNCFETSKPELDVKSHYIYNDGPRSIRQLTIGSGITEFGNLKSLVEDYLKKVEDPVLGNYAEFIGKTPLVNDTTFLKAIKNASETKEWEDSYKDVWEKKYFQPSLNWANKNNVQTNLGFLVCFDSWVHSGGIPFFLRKRFPQKAPFNSIKEEQDWMIAYIDTRRHWLSTHSRKILHSTVYRMDCFKKIIANNDWDLKFPVNAHGVIVK